MKQLFGPKSKQAIFSTTTVSFESNERGEKLLCQELENEFAHGKVFTIIDEYGGNFLDHYDSNLHLFVHIYFWDEK